MRRLSIARFLLVALLGLTVALTAIAATGVGALYAGRQDYEERLSTALRLQAGAARLLAAGVVEEATLRLTPESGRALTRARGAYDAGLTDLRRDAAGDPRTVALVEAAGRAQARLRRRPGAVGAPLAPRRPLAQLSARQAARITAARDDAERRSDRALVAIVLGGGLAVLLSLALVAGIVTAVRRPLDALVTAAGRLAAGRGAGIRVSEEDGPRELRDLARAFNAMAADVQSATARVEAERRRLETTVRALGDALVIAGADGRVEQANPRARQLVPELRPGVPMIAPAPLAEAVAREVEVERDGRTLAVTAAALEGAAGHVWTIRDVTERARLERMKSDFVATASHELRSPLTSIKGFVELLETSSELSPRQHEWIGIVQTSTDRLVELVDDLLDVTRLEAGQVAIHRRPTDVRELVEEVALLLSPRLDAARQTFAADLPADLPRALVDPNRLRQILVNLLSNAHLYTGEGGRIGAALAAEGHTLVLRVWDTGRGMSAEEAAHAFDRFYRAPERNATQGSGLGLSIVHSLVELHRGTIDVRSAPGEGTTFEVCLPGAIGTQVAAAGESARAALHGKHVLVVDDDPAIARLIVERLEAIQATSATVHSGAAALRALRAERFDAVTLDILMPGVTGFEVLRALRADPALARIPVVVVSVFSSRQALDGEWIVAKPIEADELTDALGAAIVAGRIRVLAVGQPQARGPLDAALDALYVAHEWAVTADEVARLCARRHYEVALVDAGLAAADEVIAALDLRGRRMPRAVLLFSSDGAAPVYARLDARPVAIGDAGAAVVGLLASGSADAGGGVGSAPDAGGPPQ